MKIREPFKNKEEQETFEKKSRAGSLGFQAQREKYEDVGSEMSRRSNLYWDSPAGKARKEQMRRK